MIKKPAVKPFLVLVSRQIVLALLFHLSFLFLGGNRRLSEGKKALYPPPPKTIILFSELLDTQVYVQLAFSEAEAQPILLNRAEPGDLSGLAAA